MYHLIIFYVWWVQQAFYKHVKKKGLSKFVKRGKRKNRNKADLSRVLKLLCVLSRLPAEELKNGFKKVKELAKTEIKSGRDMRKLKKLFNYYERQWLEKFQQSTCQFMRGM